jgi:CheY-like chemotaxis protein
MATSYPDWGRLRYLVVEDSPTMRAWLRNAIIGMGGKSITQAASYTDALYRINNREPFDVVLCDYILAEEKVGTTSGGQRVISRDGQHLLEECRRRRLIPTASVFIMVTGERAYERVFAVAELAPDEYLLKPMTPSTLGDRLLKAYARKQAMKPLTDKYDALDYEGGLAASRAALAAGTPYPLECLRLIGDGLLALKRHDEALNHFEQILHRHPRLPWAQLGAARANFHLDRYDESRDLLEELVAGNGDFTPAHDLLASVHEVKGSPERARALIKDVLAKNPRAVHRHREVVRLALDLGDPEDASDAYESMIREGAGSSAVEARDYSGFSTLLMQDQSPKSVDRLTQLITLMHDHHLRSDATEETLAGFKLAERVAQFARARISGKEEDAQRYYREITTSIREKPVEDNATRLALVDVAIAAGDEATASAIAREVLEDYHGNESMTARIIGTLDRAGMAQHARELREATEQAMLEHNREAVTLAKQGKLRDAMDEFIRLADRSRNLAVSFNAALAIIRWLEQNGADEALARKLAHYLEFMRNRDPDNPRTVQLADLSQPHLRRSAARPAGTPPSLDDIVGDAAL